MHAVLVAGNPRQPRSRKELTSSANSFRVLIEDPSRLPAVCAAQLNRLLPTTTSATRDPATGGVSTCPRGRKAARLTGGLLRRPGQRLAEFAPRSDPEFREDLSEMPLDRSWTQKELCADLRVGKTVSREAGDLLLLRREPVAPFQGPWLDLFPCSEQFEACSLGEGVHPDGAEQVVCGPKLIAGVHPSSVVAEPFAVQQVGTTQLGPHPRPPQMLDRLSK